MALDFPSSPTNGQVYGNYYYNSARGAWNALLPAATPNFFTNATLNTSTLVDATATSSLISTTPLVVKGLSGQTAYLQEWQNSSGTRLAGFDSNANLAVSNRVHVGTSTYAGDFWLYVVSKVAANTVVAVRGAASQTGNLQEWQNSAGTVLSKVLANGGIYSPTGSTLGSGYNLMLGIDAATTPLVVKAATSQTADLQQWQSSTGAVLSEINSAGELQVPRIGVGSIMPTTAHLHVTASAAANVPIISRGATSQTGDLQQWQDSAGSSLAAITSNGTVMSSARVIGTTPNDSGSTGGIAIKAPSGGSQTSAYLQFVNNAYTAQWGAIEATSAGTMNISATRVRMPSQPSFHAYRPAGNNWSQTTGVLPLGSTRHNIGSNYNTSNYRFTAPVAGTYMFTVHANVYSASGVICQMGIRINGSLTMGGNRFNTAGGDQDGLFAASVSLNANDYVEPYSFVGSSMSYSSGEFWNHFTGYLLG